MFSSLHQYMIDKGFEPGGIIPDGKMRRFPTNGNPKDKAGWLIAFDNPKTAAFGCWKGTNDLEPGRTGNLEAVTKAFRKSNPKTDLVICTDDDQWTKGNPGLTKAKATAKALGATVIVPQFKDLSTKPTDFNDLHALEGIAAVRRQVLDSEQKTMKKDRNNTGDTANKDASTNEKEENAYLDYIEGMTAASLMMLEFPEPKWAVEKLVPEGVVIFSGKPKSGKSVLALNMALSVAS